MSKAVKKVAQSEMNQESPYILGIYIPVPQNGAPGYLFFFLRKTRFSYHHSFKEIITTLTS